MSNINYRIIINEIKILLKIQELYYETSEYSYYDKYLLKLSAINNYINKFKREKALISKIVKNIINSHWRKL